MVLKKKGSNSVLNLHEQKSPYKRISYKTEGGTKVSQEQDSIIKDFQFIKVSARVRPVLEDERQEQKVLKVIRKADNNNMYSLNDDVISLETGAHFNNGHKFFEFSNILDENNH